MEASNIINKDEIKEEKESSDPMINKLEELTHCVNYLKEEVEKQKQQQHNEYLHQSFKKLEEENKILMKENNELKEDVKRLSTHYTQNSSLQEKVEELQHSMKQLSIQSLSSSPSYICITGMHEILENFLWLGDRFAASETKVLKQLGISYMLTLYGTHEHEYLTPIRTRCIPLNDDGSSDLGPVLKRCFEFIDEAKLKKQKILIHCAAGINRSPSIVIAYLMRTNNMRYQDAFDFVQNKRWFIDPSPPYRLQLQQYEKIISENKTTEVETLKSEEGFSLLSLLTFWFSPPSGLSRPLIF